MAANGKRRVALIANEKGGVGKSVFTRALVDWLRTQGERVIAFDADGSIGATMRICYIALGKFPHVDPYLDYFSKRGHDVHFVALTPGPRRPVPTQEVGGNGAFLRLCGKSTYIPAILRARKVVRLLCPDIVHAHYATSAGLAAYVCGIHPWVVTAHGTDVTLGVKSFLWRNLLRELFRKADCVNPVSNGLRQMVASLGIAPGKIETAKTKAKVKKAAG